jgi:HTH-type transcriptional regulator, sugar sensing transcriptional regulator
MRSGSGGTIVVMDTTTKAAVEHLQAVGFNESEALAYSTLIQRGPLTGYQLAKASGIARPNVYAVIDRLEKRGAVTAIGVGDGVKYAALPADEMLKRLAAGIDSHLSGAQEAFARMGDAPSGEHVWNLEGYDNVLAHAEAVARDAKEHLLIGNWSNESAHLRPAVEQAQARGVEVATLCVQGCAAECGNCRGAVHRYPVAGADNSRWLMLAADDREVLMGQISPGSDARAAHTTLPMIVAVGAQYLRNTIAAAEIVRSLGPSLPKLLDRDSARAIQGPELAVDGRSWLKQLLATVRRARP